MVFHIKLINQRLCNGLKIDCRSAELSSADKAFQLIVLLKKPVGEVSLGS